MVVHSGEHVDKVFFGIDAEHPAVLGEREHLGRSGPGVAVADKEPVLGTQLDRTQCVLGEIIVDP